MLTVHQLSFSFNLQTLFENATFTLNPAERVGLIGANGSGKTTLMRLLAGEIAPASGRVILSPRVRVGYLPQGMMLEPTLTVPQLIDEANGRPEALGESLAAVAEALAHRPEDEALQNEYDALLEQMGAAAGNTAVLSELGIDALPQDLPIGKLSGGQKTRLALAMMLLKQPDLLLLDEPTNHLDVSMLAWLENWLRGYAGGVLIISHDRAFLDRVVNRILYLDAERRELRDYAGNYSDYLAQATAEQEKRSAAWQAQQAEIKRVQQDINRIKQQAVTNERNIKSVRRGGIKEGKDHYLRLAKKVAKKAKSREKKLTRFLEETAEVEKPTAGWQMKFELGDVPIGKEVLELTHLAVGYDAPLLRTGLLRVQAGERVVLMGANGTGKTTLIRTIAGRLAPLGGAFRLGSSVKLGYMSQEQTLLKPDLSPVQTLQAIDFGNETAIRSYLHFYLFKDDEPLKLNRQLSYGQRARLALALLVAQGCNLLLLDEPLNHLDIPSRAQFEQALASFTGAIVAVVHDRYFVERMATKVWLVQEGELREVL